MTPSLTVVSGGSRDTNFKLLAMQGVFLILRNFLFDHRKTPFKNLFKESEVSDERQVKTDHG